MKEKYLISCLCCSYKTNSKRYSYEICQICFWEDDPVQGDDPDFDGGANGPSLRQAQRNFQEFGACCLNDLQHVRKPSESDERILE